MNFKTMLTKIAPTFGKRTLRTEIDQIEDKLKSFTIPAYASLGSSPFQSNTAIHFQKRYNDKVTRGDMFTGITATLKQSLELLDYIEEQVDVKFNEDITRATLSAYTLNMLKLVSTIGFVSDYARRLCRHIATTAINNHMKVDEVQGITKAELNFITNYQYAFFEALAVLNRPLKEIKQKLELIPEVIVTSDNYDTVTGSLGKASVDPLLLNLISTNWNPAVFFATKIARYQADKYNQAKLDLQEIQCKILKLKQLKNGREDAKLDRQIEYYENLNNKVRADIEDMEEDYEIR